MKLGAIFLVVIIVVGVVNVNAQEGEKESDRLAGQSLILHEFNKLWQDITEKGLTTKPKPEIFFQDMEEIGGRAFFNAIVLNPKIASVGQFFGVSFWYVDQLPDKNRMLIAHEVGHVVLEHNPRSLVGIKNGDYILSDKNKNTSANYNSRKNFIRMECEADVFAAQLTGRIYFLHEEVMYMSQSKNKKGKLFSLLLAPAFALKDLWLSIARGSNEFRNPLSKYKRSHSVHGPATERAILVLEGERQNCSQ